MTTKEILNLDCREKENQEIIQRVLRQIKPLSKYSDECDIPLSAIEKAIMIMCRKYAIGIMNLVPDMYSNETQTIWRATIINDETIKAIDTVYGISFYDVSAKIAIRMYSEVKRGIKLRS